MSFLAQVRYRAARAARMAWYGAHYRLGEGLQRAGAKPPLLPQAPLPAWRDLREAMNALFARDWRNIEAGIYAMPQGELAHPVKLAAQSRAFFRDLPHVARRRAEGAAREVRAPRSAHAYPPYYLQNFHYQTGGYLSEASAALYDFQVDTLFTGAADAMRRQALVPLSAALKGHDQRTMRLLDIACGTGRFLRAVKENYPALPVTGLDWSAAYLGAARRALAPWRGADFLHAKAEALPLSDASENFVTAIFLFHELPPAIRETVLGEIARVLKPGGLFVMVDSLQFGDVPDFDGLLEAFPQRFHEPYYLSYARTDFAALGAGAGLALRESTPAYLSKVLAFAKTV